MNALQLFARAIPTTLILCALSGASTGCSSGGSGADVKRIFATSTNYSGDLGGLPGADAKCNAVATAGALGGNWKAWLSDSTTDAIDRISDVGPWYRVDKATKVFNNKANLATSPIVPVLTNENGMPVPQSRLSWTATIAGGTRNTDSCSDWTAATVGMLSSPGDEQANDASWTSTGANAGCNGVHGLYCIEQ